MAEKQEELMTLKGTTESGFEYVVEKETLDDWELFEMMSEMEERPFLLNNIITTLLGKEQKEKLKDHLRNDNGKIPMEEMGKVLEEIFNQHKEAKKS